MEKVRCISFTLNQIAVPIEGKRYESTNKNKVNNVTEESHITSMGNLAAMKWSISVR